jgi:hypothetical protein
MALMPAAVALRNQDLDRLADQLAPLVAEELLHLAVHNGDQPVAVDDDDGIGRGLEQPTKLGLGRRELEPLAGRHRRSCVYVAGTSRPGLCFFSHRHLHSLSSAVSAPAS